jgi:GNAT superfamily N-acetyltransferase
MVCRPAEVRDLTSWLALVTEVEDLFGPMPDFGEHAVRGIERGSAYVVVNGNDVLGAALLSAESTPHHIRWLAVREAARRTGVGSLLMTAIQHHWPTGDVEVITFAASLPGAAPARDFYEGFGFECDGPADSAPDGGPRDVYVLRR